jgi:hypothetical protein
MQMQMQSPVVDDNTESERIKYIEHDRIWGKKVIFICGVVLFAGLLAGLLAVPIPVNYAPIYPIYPTLVRIYEYMVSYTICSHSVMCKIVSFITMIISIAISIAIFTIIVILIILLSSILFLAFIFAFTRV